MKLCDVPFNVPGITSGSASQRCLFSANRNWWALSGLGCFKPPKPHGLTMTLTLPVPICHEDVRFRPLYRDEEGEEGLEGPPVFLCATSDVFSPRTRCVTGVLLSLWRQPQTSGHSPRIRGSGDAGPLCRLRGAWAAFSFERAFSGRGSDIGGGGRGTRASARRHSTESMSNPSNPLMWCVFPLAEPDTGQPEGDL